MVYINFQKLLAIVFILVAVGAYGFFYRSLLYCFWKQSLSSNAGKVTVGVVLLLAGLGVVFSPFPLVSLLEASWLIGLALLIIVLVVFSSKLTRQGWLWLGGGVVLLIFIYSWVSIDTIVLRQEFMTRNDATPGMVNIRLFSDIAVGLMPLGLLYIAAREKPSKAAAAIVFVPMMIWWYLLFLTEGRSGILSLIFAMLVATVVIGRASRLLVAVLGVSGLAGLLGWLFFNPMARAISGAGIGPAFHRDITSNNGRFELWNDAVKYSIDYFPLGIGPMQFAGDGQIRYASAHNLFLNISAEWGVPLALLLLGGLVYSCWIILRRSRKMPGESRPVYACLVMAFVGVVVNLQFSGAQVAPLSALVMAMGIGLCLGYRSTFFVNECSPVTVQIVPTLFWASCMLITAYLLYAGLELYWLSVESVTPCIESLGQVYIYPRFWGQGRLECMQAVAPDHWLFWSWR